MRYLSAEELLAIHELIVNETGGSHGVRDLGLLQSIAAKPAASFGGMELYVSLHLKAAVLLEAIANYHVFIDGNKRTSLAAAFDFLDLNGFRLVASNIDSEETVLKVATKEMLVEEIALWLKNNSRRIKH